MFSLYGKIKVLKIKILKNFIVFIGYFQLILNLQIKLHNQLLKIGLKRMKTMRQKVGKQIFFLKG